MAYGAVLLYHCLRIKSKIGLQTNYLQLTFSPAHPTIPKSFHFLMTVALTVTSSCPSPSSTKLATHRQLPFPCRARLFDSLNVSNVALVRMLTLMLCFGEVTFHIVRMGAGGRLFHTVTRCSQGADRRLQAY